MTDITTAGALAIELATRIGRIRTATGFETEIGRTVWRGRRKMPGDDEPPCSVVYEGPDDVVSKPGRIPQLLVSQSYFIDGFDKCDPDNPNDQAHKMIRDIKRALFVNPTTGVANTDFEGRVRAVDYIGRDIGPRPDGGALVHARVMILIQYIETLGAS